MAWSSVVVEKLRDEVNAAVANPKDLWGIASYGKNWPTLDKITGGIQRNEFVVLYSRPGIGKSRFICDILPWIAAQADEQDKVVRIVSLEMTIDAFMRDTAAFIAGIKNPERIRQGYLLKEERDGYGDALNYLAQMPIEILALENPLSEREALIPGYSGVSVREITQFLGKPDTFWWALDHIGLVDGVDGKDVTNSMFKIVNQLMFWAHTNVGGMALTHMTRDSVGKRATIAAIANTDQAGKNADKAISLQRPWEEAQVLSESDQALRASWNGWEPGMLTITKNRDGKTGMIPVGWNAELAKLSELTLKPGEKLLMPGQKKESKK